MNTTLFNRTKLFRGILGVALLATSGGIPVFGLLAFSTENVAFWALFGIVLLAVIVYLAAWKAASFSVDMGMYLTLLAIILSVTGALLVLGTRTPVVGALMLAPFVAGLLSRHTIRDVFLSSSFVMLIMTGLSVGEQVFKLYKPSLDLTDSFIFSIYIWASLIGIVGAAIMVFARNTNQALALAEQHTKEKIASLESIRETSSVTNKIIVSLNSVTTELSATATMQASNFQEQVAAINQVTTNLEELAESAEQIASNVLVAASSVSQTVDSSLSMKTQSELAGQVSDEGNQAIRQVIEGVQKISQRIEMLAHRLLELTQNSRNIDQVLNLINEIASETHLLALNASIEASGTVGETSGGKPGARFAVIAQEIGSLAKRSQEATEQVRATVTEMQGSVAAAVMAAEEGRKETALVIRFTTQAGGVLESLNQTMLGLAQHVEDILSLAEKAQSQNDQIKLSAGQQRSATHQTLNMMQNILYTSQQSANSVVQTAQVVSEVNEQVGKLNQVLVTTS